MSQSSAKIIELAERVLEKTKIVDSYFKEHGLPEPSFASDGPSDFGIKASDAHINEARMRAVEAAKELSDLLQGPMTFLRPVNSGISLHAISRWDIATKVPVGGEVSFADLARACRVPETDMRRLLRYAMVHHRLFCEPRPGYVAHSLASRMLAEDPLLRDGFWLLAEDYFTAAPHAVAALERWPKADAGGDAGGDDEAEEPNHTAFSLREGTHLNPYEFLSAHPPLARRFALAMSSFARYPSQPTTAPRAEVLQAFDWASLGSSPSSSSSGGGLVVDVGGSRGADAIRFARAHPALRFVVQDMASMIAGAEAAVPEDVRARVAFMAYDFFTPQTVAADAYLIKQCFHNWPDHYCVRILKNQVPALRAGARLVVVDSVVPPPGQMTLVDEMGVRAFDMMMLAHSARGREREEGDWLKIFAQADERFKVDEMKTLHTPGDFGPSRGIILVTWQG